MIVTFLVALRTVDPEASLVDGEGSAEGLRETAGQEGDGDVVKDEAVSREVTVPIFQEEPN